MTTITVRVPDKSRLALKTSAEALGAELMLAAAVKLCELGRLSTGAAAELAGIPKPVFLSKLAEFGVATFDLSEQDLLREQSLV